MYGDVSAPSALDGWKSGREKAAAVASYWLYKIKLNSDATGTALLIG